MGILQNAKINSLIKWLWNSKTDSELLDKMFPAENETVLFPYYAKKLANFDLF